MLKRIFAVTTIIFFVCTSSDAQSYKWRIGGEWVMNNLKRYDINSTSAGVGITVERQWRGDSAFRISAAFSYVYLYGASPRISGTLYELNLPILYAKGSYKITRTVDVNLSAGSSTLGAFVAPGLGQSWKRFQFNFGYRINVIPYGKTDYYHFKNHIATGILYNFIRN